MLALVQNFYLSIYLYSLNRVRNLNVSYVKIHIYRLQFVDPDVLWQRCWRQSSSILATDRKNNFSDEVWRRLACIITTLYVECVACSAFLPPVNSNRVVIRAEHIQHSASCRQMSAGYIQFTRHAGNGVCPLQPISLLGVQMCLPSTLISLSLSLLTSSM